MTGPPDHIEFWPVAPTVDSAKQIAAKVVERWGQTGPPSRRTVRGGPMRCPWRMMQELSRKAEQYRDELTDLGGPVWPLPKARPWATLPLESERNLEAMPGLTLQLEQAERIERMVAAQECQELADCIADELHRAGCMFATDVLTLKGCAA